MCMCVREFAVGPLETSSDMPCSHSRRSNLSQCRTITCEEVCVCLYDLRETERLRKEKK